MGIKKHGDQETYKRQFKMMSKQELLDDLIEEIYINAEIATAKYAKYNKGLQITIIGFIAFVVLLVIGIYLLV